MSEAQTPADRVVVSYPAELSDWGRDQLESDRYVNYLRKTVGGVFVGKEWEEFADVGCCGDTLDVPLRVEAVEGGDAMGPETEIEFAERDAEMRGGWLVQSAAGPEPER
ncbi:hypothetical protein [Halegenticoccus soli]|uniref:hypothetical protein n=1 Tax=Halegenticoccus soli TaxID=1985678 RepID=UPI000C6DCD43|nr:hypothetical protein [Halegenticoccus soli]